MDKSERWDRIEELFLAAVKRPAEQREAFLREVDELDRELVGEVIELVAAHDKGNELLDHPALPAARRLLNEPSTKPAVFFTQGAKLGDYRIVALLGKGGMGEVYLAEDARLRRKVALKILPPNLSANSERLRRFIREAYAISGLNHPNIITIFEIGESEGLHYLATEYIQGKTLRDLCRERRPGAETAIEIITQVASALAAAHSEGVVHRDIKPENIMVRPDGLVKVLDFGLAKLDLQEREPGPDEAGSRLSGASLPGLIVGTPTYMSPEQAAGKPADARSDLFSLGVVAYELLSGAAPFTGSTPAEILASVVNNEPPPLSKIEPNLPTDLERVVNRLLCKDPAKRYDSATDLFEELKSVQMPAIGAGREVSLTVDSHNDQVAALSASPSRPISPSTSSTLVFTASRAIFRSLREHRVFSACTVLVFVVLFSNGTSFLAGRGVIDSVAILPFVNETSDASLDYVSDGLTEGLINSLSKVQGVRVSPRESVFSLRGKPVNYLEVADKLRVKVLVSARISKHNQVYIVSAELFDPREGHQLWGGRYERQSRDVSALLGEIVQDLASQLRLRLATKQFHGLSENQGVDADAYEQFLKGRFFWNKRSKEALIKSIEYFRQAIEQDPAFADAYAGCAAAFVSLGANFLPPSEVIPQARFYSARALELNPILADAHYASAAIKYAFDWEWEESEHELRMTLSHNPNHVPAHSLYSNLLRTLARPVEALEYSKRAATLDPLSLLATSNLGAAFYSVDAYDEGDSQFRKILAIDPRYVESHLAFAWTFESKGEFAKALAELRLAAEISPSDPSVLTALGRVHARQNDKANATRVVSALRDLARTQYVSPFLFAEVFAEIGEKNRAFEELEKAFEGRCAFLTLLSERGVLTPLRGDPRFINLLKRMANSIRTLKL